MSFLFAMNRDIPIPTLHLFPKLDAKLIELLKSLNPEEWDKQTVAKLWKVKDVAAHLLDGNIRGLSISRDEYFGTKAENIHSYQDLVNFLNGLNLSWTSAAQRMSPQVLTHLLEVTGGQYSTHLQTLDPYADAIFSVAWAGQEISPNWFHIAREYTEKFLHQQQIRDAVGKQGILTREFFFPFIDTVMRALPHTFRSMEAKVGTTVGIEISTDIGGIWVIKKEQEAWVLLSKSQSEPESKITLDPNTAWKLFSKSWRPTDVQDLIILQGNEKLASHALTMLGFMA